MTLRRRLTFGPFLLEGEDARLLRGTADVPLRPRAFALLRYFVEHPGRLLSKQELLSEVWPGVSVSETVLRVCVREIRDVLDDHADAPQYIETLPRRGYRFIAPVASAGAEGGRIGPLSLVVGRQRELAALRQWLAAADAGERKIVFVTGEPGVGKTTLVDLFLDQTRVRERMPVGRGQCLERYGEGEAYLPVLEAVGRLCREPGGDVLVNLLRQFAPTWTVHMPALFTDAEIELLHRRVQGSTRGRMLREITEALETFAADKGLVLVLEDLQWSDHSTLEIISYLAHRRERVPLMIIGTYRSGDVAGLEHPLQPIKQELHAHGHCEELAIDRLTPAEVAEYVARRVPAAPRAPAITRLVSERTEGNALFMVNLVEYAMRQGFFETDGAPEGAAAGFRELEGHVPANLRQMIMKQIEGLGGAARPLLEVASVVGVEFGTAVVATATDCEPEEAERQCDALAGPGQLLDKRPARQWPDGTVSARYRFAHGLYQQVLYEQLGDARRVRLHRALAERTETGYGARAHEVAAELAYHFEQGREHRRAVQYYRDAAENLLSWHAYDAAARYATRGLALLPEIPDEAERLERELWLRTALGHALLPRHGSHAPAVEEAYARALELCQQVGDTPRIVPILLGLWTSYRNLGKLQAARNLAERLLRIAETGEERALRAAHFAQGAALLHAGELARARTHLERCAALAQPEREDPQVLPYAFDVAVRCLCYLSVLLYVQGYPEQALRRSAEALTVARETSSPFEIAYAEIFAALVRQLRGDWPAMEAAAEAAVALATDHELTALRAPAEFLRAWGRAERGEHDAGFRAACDTLSPQQPSGMRDPQALLRVLLGMGYARVGRVEDGLEVLDGTLRETATIGEHLSEAELHRVRGDLLLWRAGPGEAAWEMRAKHRQSSESEWAEAEACMRRALELARQQGAKAWELRAAMSLARLLQHRGEGAVARGLLVEIHGWFSEGQDTADLRAATALLGELGGPGGEVRYTEVPSTPRE